MNHIKVSELFYSLQGEGRYMGVPSVFLRTYGCNFKCAGFGMPKGELSIEADNIATHHKNVKAYESYEGLPLVTTGCDSYASWHPAFKNLSPFMEIDELANKIVDLLPSKKWSDEHLVITGGEPLLGWQKEYIHLLNHSAMDELSSLTFETNGTQKLTEDFKRYLYIWGRLKRRDITFSVSAKLSCSGEPRDKAIRPDVVCDYQEIGFTYLKFVVATEDDVEEVIETVDIYRAEGFEGPVYVMPVGGVNEVYNLNNKRVAELALKNGLRYSDRLHLPLFGNSWGT